MPLLSLCHLVVTLGVIINTATPSVIPPPQGPDPGLNPDPDPDPDPQPAWYNPFGRTKLYSEDELTAMHNQVTSDIRAARGDSSQVEKLKKLQYAINQALDSLEKPQYGAAGKAVAHETLRRLTKKFHWTRRIKTGGKIVGGALAGFGAFELAKKAKEKLEEEGDDGDDKSWWQFWKKSKKNTKGKWPKGFKLGLPGTGGGKNNGKGPFRLPKPKPTSGMFSPMGIAFISLLGFAVLGLFGYWFLGGLAFEDQEEEDERTRRTRRKKNRNSGSPSRKRQSRKRRRREDDDDSTK